MKKTRAYKIITTKSEIKIDEDEFERVVKAMGGGSIVMVRQGVVNPSYIISIEVDRERLNEWHRECNYGDENGARARTEGMKPLANILPESFIEKYRTLSTKKTEPKMLGNKK